MSSLKDFGRACGLGVAAVLVAAVAHAQPSDKRTFFTFSRPITLPGVTLPAGKYIFRLTDDQTFPQGHSGRELGRHEAVRHAAHDSE